MWERLRPILRDTAVVFVTSVLTLFGIHVLPPALTPGQPAPEARPEPLPNPPATPLPKPDPWNAIVQISGGNSFCSATVIGPRRNDGKWNLVSAAHCVKGKGQSFRVKFRNGKTTTATVHALNRGADCAVLVTTESTLDDLPFCLLSSATPPIGANVWHGGYGVDRPGNKEAGVVSTGPDGNGQVSFKLSVSSGDSGGGIIWTDQGLLVSTVCCTTRRGGPGRVWGASPEAIAHVLPQQVKDEDNLIPVEIPLRDE